MLNKEQVMKLLYQVIDPEIGINIVDLGLIYDVQLNEGYINVIMTLTTPGCPMHETITQWVENILRHADKERELNVDLVWDPRWTPDRMSDEAKAQLGMN
jgi:metal-sulfur cluster biosynthetic enzyme